MYDMRKALVCDKNVSIVTQSKLNNFFYGDYYLAYISLLTAFFYCANLSVLGLAFFVILGCFILILFRDLTPLIPLPLFVVLAIRDLSIFNDARVFLIFIPAIFCFITHFALYPVKKIFFGKLFLPLIAVCVALFLGGLFSDEGNFQQGLPTVIMIGPIVFIAYFLFSQYIQPRDNFNVCKFMFATLVFLGVASSIELFAHRMFFSPPANFMSLGWGNVNTVSSIMLLAIPSCIYMMLYGKSPVLYVVILVLLYGTVILTHSEAVMGLSVAFAPIIAVAVITNGKLKSRKLSIFKNVIFVLVGLITIAFVIITVLGYFDDLVNILFLEMSDDSQRTDLYILAFEVFKNNPLFGVGQGFIPIENTAVNISGLITFNFHSTFIHVLATMGIFGTLVYGYYFFARYRIITKNNTPENLFAFFTFTMFEIYAAVDTGEFSLIPLMLAVTSLLAVIEFSNNNPHRQPLPLALNINFQYVLGSSYKKLQ